jgi:hypothetical protein
VHRVWASDLGDRGNHLSPHAHAAADVVRGGVVDDRAEAGRLGARAATVAGARVLPDSVGDVAPVSFGCGYFRTTCQGG